MTFNVDYQRKQGCFGAGEMSDRLWTLPWTPFVDFVLETKSSSPPPPRSVVTWCSVETSCMQTESPAPSLEY